MDSQRPHCPHMSDVYTGRNGAQIAAQPLEGKGRA